MDIFEYAIKMETDGEAYYRELAGRTKNKGLKSILTMLAEEEVRHRNVITAMKAEQPELPDSSLLSEAKNIFSEMKGSGEKIASGLGQAGLYEKAQDLEQKSREFYLEKARRVEEEDQKTIFLKLAEEENRHCFLLESIIEFVSRPENWLENAEFNHLDEY